MRLPLYQVDAFADAVFTGNPAAVMPLESWLPAPVMQAIAAENNLSETAFFVAAGQGWHLRWFTPDSEVDLCGHATLATAHVLFRHLRPGMTRVTFSTETAGPLAVDSDGDRLSLDFPARPADGAELPPGLLDALGAPAPAQVLKGRDYVLVFDDEAVIRALKPDFATLARLGRWGTVVTAPGTDADFVSRFFAPGLGIPEDPVTGSTHCTLVPYWARRLGRTSLHAAQLSARGGQLWCTLAGERVRIAGRAVTFMEGVVTLQEQS